MQIPVRKIRRLVPRHIQLAILFACVLFSLSSAKITAFEILYAKDMHQPQMQEAAPQTVSEISLHTTSSSSKKIKFVQRSQVTVVKVEEGKATPTPTKPSPTPIKPGQKQDEKSTEKDEKSTAAGSVSTGGGYAQDVLRALNSYRQKKGKRPVSWDGKLGGFAQSRAEQFARDGKMDNHAGFQGVLHTDGFKSMGFYALGENSSYGYQRDAGHLIEGAYGGHGPHDENQLKDDWTHVGIGVAGDATNLVFGGRKI